MDYNQVRNMAADGINLMSDSDGIYEIIVSGGGVQVIEGEEVHVEPVSAIVKGLVRDVNSRDVDGETILAGDKRGIFSYHQEIKKDMRIIVDGETYVVVNPRPIKPTGTVIAYRPILRRVAVYGGK